MAAHLTFQERQFLYRLKRQGKSKAEMARLMGRDRSTISRELRRIAGQRGYRPKQAQRLAEERRLACRRPHKLDDPEMRKYVAVQFEKLWSPDQIAARRRLDFPRQRSRWLSDQTIYDWINTHNPQTPRLSKSRRSPCQTTLLQLILDFTSL